MPVPLRVRARQRGAPRFPIDPERQRPGPSREYHVSELPPEEQARYQPERPTRADLEAAAAAGRTVEDVAEQFQRPISRVVGLCKHYRLVLRMRPKPEKREEGDDEMRRFTADDFLRVLRKDPDMPTEVLAARMELTDANLYYHARRHGGVAALRERALALAGAVPVAASPAPVVEPHPAQPVDDQAGFADDPRPGTDPPPAAAPVEVPGEAMTPTPRYPVPDLHEGSVDFAAEERDEQIRRAMAAVSYLTDPLHPRPGYRHSHYCRGPVNLGTLRQWVANLGALIGPDTPLEVDLTAGSEFDYRQQVVLAESPPRPVTPFRLFTRRNQLPEVPLLTLPRWEQHHSIDGRIPLRRLEEMLENLARVIGDEATVEAHVRSDREAAS